MSWLDFDSLSAQAEKALQGAVAKIDATLDIKEDPSAILSDSAGKSKLELLEENRSHAAVDAVQAKISTASTAKTRGIDKTKPTTRSNDENQSSEDFFGIFGANSPPRSAQTSKAGEADVGSKKPTVATKQKRAVKKTAAGVQKPAEKAAANGKTSSPEKARLVSHASPTGTRSSPPAVRPQPSKSDDSGPADVSASLQTNTPGASQTLDIESHDTTPDTGAPKDINEAARPPDLSSPTHEEEPPGADDSRGAEPTVASAVVLPTDADQATVPTPLDEVPSVSPGPTEEEITTLDPVAASYAKKLAHVSMVLAAREEKLVQLSAELAGKSETHHVLLAQNEQLEAQLKDNLTGQVEKLTAEFTDRLGETESRLKQAAQERDSLRTQLEKATSKFSERIGQTDKLSGEVLAEKDAKIDALMSEGQKLQQKLHESGQRNKKLHAKLKEGDAAAASLTTRLEAAQERIAALEKELATKAAKEEKYKATANQVSAVQDQQSKELIKAKQVAKSLTDKNSSLQAALDTAFKAKAELEKQLAEETVKASSAMTAAESAASAAKAAELKYKEEEFEQVKADLHAEITDLRGTLTRQQGQADRRESNFQQEIADLNDRLRHAEQREQQISESVANSTKPLVRQIDMLRSSLAEQTANADVVEASLIARVEEQAVALQAAEERERQATEKLSEERLRSAGVDDKLSSLRKSKIELQAKLEKQMSQADDGELKLHKAQQECKELATTLDDERAEWRVEKTKLKTLAADTLKIREDEWQRERELLTKQVKEASASKGLSAPMTPSTPRPASPSAVARPTTLGTPAGAIERLNGEVMHKDESLLAARRQIDDLTKSRTALADELVVLVGKNEELSKQCTELPKVKAALKEMEEKLDAVMVMYGEKKEEASELRLDLQDFRQLYQVQTQQLCDQIEQLTTQLQASKTST